MGAGVALNLTERFPERVRALVLVRPAWLATPLPENLHVFLAIAQLLRDHGPERGQKRFRTSAAYREMAETAPDAAASLLRQFEHPRAVETLAKLEQLPRDAPIRHRADLARCDVPALVLLNHQDPLHPYALGLELAQTLPQAHMLEIPSKSVSPERHQQAAQHAIATFLEHQHVVWHGSRRSEVQP
jgi:pimeloyl-ACP methyl ester carboxylesterase